VIALGGVGVVALARRFGPGRGAFAIGLAVLLGLALTFTRHF
jgi:hypothetical protein